MNRNRLHPQQLQLTGKQMAFPKILYVSVQNTGRGHKDDEFMNATENPAGHAETGEVVTVARYQLVDTGTVTAEPLFVPGKKRR
jgi:hypothetical protein